MLSEEEKKAVIFLKHFLEDDDVFEISNKDLRIILNLIEKQQKELNNLKEIEKTYQEENGKLRFELEKITSEKSIGERQYRELLRDLDEEKEKINTIKKLMSIGDITDEALFTLVQTTIAELERLEDIEEQLEQEKEKNKLLQSQLNGAFDRGFISKDKIKERMEQTKKVYDEEMKPYMIDVGNGEKILNVTYLSKKEKEELINKRNCLLVQIKTYEDLLEEK